MYYVRRNNQDFGPYPEDDLKTYIEQGNFEPWELCWKEGMDDWQPIKNVIAIAPKAPLPMAPPPFVRTPVVYAPQMSVPQTQAPSPHSVANTQLLYESQKKSAGLACFLNFILPGVGYMYAGRVGIGIFVLLIWVACICLFFLVIPLFIAAIIWFAGLIDGYLAVEKRNKMLALQLIR